MKQFACLAHQPWSAIPTRTAQLLTRLKEAQILYFEPPAGKKHGENRARRVRPNIYVYTLPALPDPKDTSRLSRRFALNRTLSFLQNKLAQHRFQNPVLWVTHPVYQPVVDGMTYRGLIYDCDTYYPAWLGDLEGALAQAADVIFAASPGLMDRLSPCNGNIALIPNGVNFPMFSRTELDVPRPLAGLKGPVFGWVGDLAAADFEPVEYAASQHPQWTFVLAGGGQSPWLPRLQALSNVLLTGPCPFEELPDYMGRFDVLLHLLPSRREETDVIPEVIFEYLSTGKPIVSMIYEDQVEDFPDVIYAAHTPQEFSALCGRALNESPGFVSQRRKEYGRNAAWSLRADEVRRILEGIALY